MNERGISLLGQFDSFIILEPLTSPWTPPEPANPRTPDVDVLRCVVSAGMSCSQSRVTSMSAGDNSSDYGSDFTPDEEALVDELLASIATEDAVLDTDRTTAEAAAAAAAAKAAVNEPIGIGDVEDYCHAPGALGRKRPDAMVSGAIGQSPQETNLAYTTLEHPTSTEGRERSRERDIAREEEWATAGKRGRKKRTASTTTTPATDTSLSPIERFRQPPNKAFSVSDLISPAWCELQYWYTLTKYGRKRRTVAMKKGTTIHQALEDELHTTVAVKVTTKEDALALRIWNIIQGFQTLRESGMTRELEVWGLVDGELVNGVIDQLSYECPDPELEASSAAHYANLEASRVAAASTQTDSELPQYQMSLTDYFLSSQRGKRLSEVSWGEDNEGLDLPTPPPPPPDAYSVSRVYLTDNKTRGTASAPSVKSTSFRPTLLQLQMYYHMLNRLTTSDEVSIQLLASRYDLDPEKPFSDDFIAEVGGLSDEFFDVTSSREFDPDFIPSPEDATRKSPPPNSQESVSVLLHHNSLSSLWGLMKDQLRLTFLPPAPEVDVHVAPSIPSDVQPALLDSYPTTISPLLSAHYISSSNSKILGTRSFLYDPTNLTSYLSNQMSWWRGHRDPQGVDILEAWKCRICEFNDECEWRQEKAFSLANRNRSRKRATA